MKKQKDETTIIITPKQLRRLKLGLRERTKVRERKEKVRQQQYYK